MAAYSDQPIKELQIIVFFQDSILNLSGNRMASCWAV